MTQGQWIKPRYRPPSLNAQIEAAEAEVARLNVALNKIDAARANAVAEIEALHRYLDECFVNDRDEGRAVPLIDRVVLLVSQIARDSSKVETLDE